MVFHSPTLHIREVTNNNEIHIICVGDVIRVLSQASVARSFHKANSKDTSNSKSKGYQNRFYLNGFHQIHCLYNYYLKKIFGLLECYAA